MSKGVLFMASKNFGRVASGAITRSFIGGLAGFGVALAVLIGVGSVATISSGVFAGTVLGSMAAGALAYGVAGGYKATDSAKTVDAKVRTANAQGVIANAKSQSVEAAKGKAGKTDHAETILAKRAEEAEIQSAAR